MANETTRAPLVLIAEDSPTQALDLEDLLTRNGYRTRVCTDGAEALEAMRRERPDVVVSDIVMPRMTGFALCGAMHEDPGLRDIPIILVTSLSDPEDVMQGLEAGADSFVTKPFDEAFLCNRVRFLLLHRQLRDNDQGRIGLEIELNGRSRYITSDRLQILNLLLSTYEVATQRNAELQRSEAELRRVVDELHAANAQLAAQAADLRHANQALESFTYTASHDLRAPIRHISAYAGMLREDAGDTLAPALREHLDAIEERARHMDALMNELLAYSRLARKRVECRPIDMEALARQALCDVDDAAAKAARIEIAPLPPLQGDPVLMRQVWCNLLSNAIKYSAPRGADARVEVTGTTDGRTCRYLVRDNGVGFDPRHAERLFGVFQRLHGGDEFEGTGVGLAIVRSIVERHGGRVWAESEPGAGATFGFELPAGPAAP